MDSSASDEEPTTKNPEEHEETDDSGTEHEESGTDNEKPKDSNKVKHENPKVSNKVHEKPASSHSNNLQKTTHPSYKNMVYEAVKELDQKTRNGIAIRSIIKYIVSKYAPPESLVKFNCRKAIEKGLKDELFVQKTGSGMTGSIKFSAKHINKIKEKDEVKDKPKKATKSKKTEKPTTKAKKAESRVKPAKSSEGNSSKHTKTKSASNTKSIAKKPTGTKKTVKSSRTSIVVAPTKPLLKAKPKPKAKTVVDAKKSKSESKKGTKKTLAKAGPSSDTRNKKTKK